MARTGGVRDPQGPLRRRAEALLRRRQGPAQPPGAVDLRRVVHELEVHQVELQMQNQELLDAQAALTTARDRYASLFDRAPVAYLVLDHAGTVIEANDAACALLARPRHRLRRRTLASFVAHDDRTAVARHLEEAATTVGRTRPLRVTLEGVPARIARLETIREVPGPDGRRDYRTTMIDITDQALGEQRLRAERTALERSQATLRELTRRLMSAEEDERRRIAADLHDDIGQRLHAVQIELEIFGRRRATQAPGVSTVRRHLEEVISDLEGLARNLHPKIVDDLGLRVALKGHAEDLGHQAGMAVRFRERAVPAVVPANAATCLYRVAQEALRNVHRHAGARAATVTLARVRRGLGLCVADGGRGFDPTQTSGRGLGLVTMNERVSALGGHFRIRTNPGDGTHVHAWVPLP
jgi:PAS domain S-box-containing protein